jgi:tartrate dehydrogenase/decarboxylase/D-malate dehydrogenase
MIWSGVMMLDHLGENQAADHLIRTIEKVLETGPRTPDMGGTATTLQVGDAIAEAI